MIGEANEVPFAVVRIPSVPITSAKSPTATTSGFILPSAVFPIEENGANTPSLSTAPTVITLKANISLNKLATNKDAKILTQVEDNGEIINKEN